MKLNVYNGKYDENLEQYLKKHNDYTVWHSNSWFDSRIKSGKINKIYSFSIEENGVIICGGVVQISKRSRFFKYGYIQAGFLYNYCNKEIISNITKCLKEIASNEKLIYIEIDSTKIEDKDYNNLILFDVKKALTDFKPVIPSFTNIIDITKTEEEILDQMKPKGRYNIKLAAKKGVTVRSSSLVDDIKTFYQLLVDTTERDGFKPNNFNYYKNFIDTIENSILLIAEHENEIIAAGIFTYYGNQALYYYGASSNNKRNLMAPYLLQWEALREGKKRGCLYYDFMGIADPEKADDPLAGVTDFKLKFGGNVVKFNLPVKIITNQIKYNIFTFLHHIKNRLGNFNK